MTIYRGVGGTGDTTTGADASASATVATEQAAIATAQAVIATDQADIATTQASNASTSASGASTSASNAASSASAASTSATNASNSATASANSATAASGSATSASNSATSASNSASSASTSASTATTQASNASTSATNAANSASSASTSATNASNSASAAATSATNASNSASSAATSATNAANSYDAFDDRYLGSKASAPTLDNDGASLLTGALYWDTTLNTLRGYNGASWVNLPASTASAITNTPAGNLSSTNVQAALNELDTEKAKVGANSDITSLTGLSGNVSFTGTGNRIIGDFSNATLLSRVAFQTSTTNGATNVTALPNGTGNVGGFIAFNSADPTNSSFAQFATTGGVESRFTSGITGSGSYLPMTFYTGGVERMRIDTAGTASFPKTNAALSAFSYNTGNIEIRGTGSSPPILGFHYEGVVARTMHLTSEGFFQSINNSGVTERFFVGPATGSAPCFACRAWVNFNGTGTVAIRASGNVSSITDNGTGSFTLNFSTAMPDADYSFTGNCGSGVVTGVSGGSIRTFVFSDSSVSFGTGSFTNSYALADFVNTTVSIFR